MVHHLLSVHDIQTFGQLIRLASKAYTANGVCVFNRCSCRNSWIGNTSRVGCNSNPVGNRFLGCINERIVGTVFVRKFLPMSSRLCHKYTTRKLWHLRQIGDTACETILFVAFCLGAYIATIELPLAKTKGIDACAGLDGALTDACCAMILECLTTCFVLRCSGTCRFSRALGPTTLIKQSSLLYIALFSWAVIVFVPVSLMVRLFMKLSMP